MTKFAIHGLQDTEFSMRPDVRIEVKNFGPVETGIVDLRPLTIFVGPSNTGKTYLAILIYALHRILRGFPRLPAVNYYLDAIADKLTIPKTEFENVVANLNADERPFRFSDLPESMRDTVQFVLEDPALLADELKIELERCFDLDSFSSLIRLSDNSDETKVFIKLSDKNHELWHFFMKTSNSNIMSSGKIGNITLIQSSSLYSDPAYQKRLRRFRCFLTKERRMVIERLITYLFGEFSGTHPNKNGEIYYLPSARSGIMQSHRVIASSLMPRLTRVGLERFPELPTFSGVMIDFMQRLIWDGTSGSFDGSRRRQTAEKTMKDIANTLELRTLDGQILTKTASPGGYPEFVYRPREAEQDIRLTRASSMVSELAPVVLFIRGNLRKGDTLIIEEPEAHLHPAAQTQMAATLASLVRNGVRVVITTHSDWLLKEIGNLMREGELEEQAGKSEKENTSSASLRPRDVGIWLFHKEDPNQGSTVKEIKFDRIEGIEPSDYEAVADKLYNRSADLQNQLEETLNGGRAKA